MRFRDLLIFIILLTFSLQSRSQYFDTGTDPAGLKWLQIRTRRFTLIYPQSYSEEAMKYAGSLDRSLDRLQVLYPGFSVRMPIVIHSYTTFSNGYVAWAPRRIEMFPTPEQNTIPLDPVEQLTQHELTHVMQLYSLRQRSLKILSYAGGEQVTGASVLFFPLWFIEGDAVLAESLLTPSGRGRTAAFQKDLKAIVLSGNKLYSYDKMMLGSFRNYTPDYYQSGYQIVAWSSLKYGHGIWNNAFSFTSGYPFTLNPAGISLKKNTGYTQSGLYTRTFNSLVKVWNDESERIKPDTYNPVNKAGGKDYSNYHSPVAIGKDSLAVIKTSLSGPPVIVLLRPQLSGETRIFTPGMVWPYFLSGARGKIVWVEQRPDPRWENRTYSDIIVYNIKTHSVTRLSRNKRYMAAAISPDGKLVAACENSVSNKNRLLIIDASGGNILTSAEVPGNEYLQRPEWSEDGNFLTFISLGAEGEGILSWNEKTGEWKRLLQPARNDLQSSMMMGDTLYYVTSESGTDNIFVRLPGGETRMVTNSRFGANDPLFTGDKMYFSDYTFLGSRICSLSQKEITGRPVAISRESFIINGFDSIKYKPVTRAGEIYKPEPYRKWQHPFRLHSWLPFYTDIDQLKTASFSASPGLTLLSQNTLSTVITSLGYEYTQGRNNLHYKFTWKGRIPVFESSIDYGARPLIYKLGNSVGDPLSVSPKMSFTNSVSLPLSFSTGYFSQFFWSSLSAGYRNDYIYIKESGLYDPGQLQVKTRLFFSNYGVPALRDIYPRWAQVIDFTYVYYPFDKSIYGPLTSLKTEFYFPGVARNHGLRLRYQSDYQDPRKLVLYNIADLPRGYNDIVSINYRLGSADYVFPVVYPDISVPPLVYLKRIRGTLFCDYATGRGNYHLLGSGNNYVKGSENFYSYGGQLIADFYMFRLPLLMSGGIQAAWLNNTSSPVLQAVFNINIFGMEIGKSRL
ncbi:MAG TPA: hypothetical protein VMT63_08595 [Bacteroidales bacterium]|nr:hypothetical protein [Bacteroidales bacterium]